MWVRRRPAFPRVRQVDLAIESGEYFLKPQEKEERARKRQAGHQPHFVVLFHCLRRATGGDLTGAA